VIASPQTLTALKVVRAAGVQAKDDIDSPLLEQRRQPVRAVVAIGHHHIAMDEPIQQRAKETGLSGLLALVRPQGGPVQNGRGKADQNNQAE
jgi:hypothetical protein